MTRPGPRPKPAEIRKREGTYRKDRHGDVVVIGGRPDVIEPPVHLKPAAKAVWLELVPVVRTIVDRADMWALEAMVMEIVRWREAEALLEEQGLWVASPNGYLIAHPAIAVATKAKKEYRDWSSRFGLTPSDRIGLGIQAVKKRSLQEDLSDKIGPIPRSSS